MEYDDKDFEILCLKIDMDRDCRVKFNEFISYFITELQNDDNEAEQLAITLPIAESANVISTKQETEAIRIFYIPAPIQAIIEQEVTKILSPSLASLASPLPTSMMTTIEEKSKIISDGCYLLIRCSGDIYVWSFDWKLEQVIYADTVPATYSSTIEMSDMEGIKKNPKLLILDAIVMTSMNIICISSVCCDLRFYDISIAGKCDLRLYIRNFPSPLNTFYYYEELINNNDDDDNDDMDEKISRLIFGDFVGSVRMIDFKKNFKSNFRMGAMIRQISYQDLMEGQFDTMKCFEFMNLHSDIIRQVYYSSSLTSIISASESSLTPDPYLPGVIITKIDIPNSQTVFKMNNGTTCFALNKSSQTLATGGPDTILRLWDIKQPSIPKAILIGHTAGIVNIFFQDDEKLYTIDKLKFVKIWDVELQSLQQTFAGLKPIFPKDLPIITFYNDAKRELIAAGKKIATLKCNPRINPDTSDGITHTTPVTLILFNELYQFLASCGTDSTIIVWDLWRGRKVNWIFRAHTVLKHGEVIPIKISAGCFDTKHQYLVTGGEDGSIKIWNMNEGLCVRSLHVNSFVRNIFWTNDRIFAISDVVTEFNDNNDYKQQINIGKTWLGFHAGDITCASLHYPDALVTACSHGDLIFWNYENGQPYMRFNMGMPTQRLQIVYQKNKNMKTSSSSNGFNITSHCMISLNKRPLNVSNGTLLVSLSNGRIQVWSHHDNTKCYITDFNAIHVADDVITAMATDSENCYLFTGSSLGYIKAWMIVNFCHSTSIEAAPSRQILNLRFPFLLRDEIEGRAKRAVRNQLHPLLLNSYKGHKGASITSLIYSEKNQILISSSVDKTVRLWNLSGQYINTIGSHVKWQMLSPNKPLPPDFTFNFPADLKSVVSYTTLKVLEGGNIPTLMTRNINELEKEEEEIVKQPSSQFSVESMESSQYDRILSRPVVKKEDEEKKKERLLYEKPSLDISLPHIPIYRHLRIHRTVPINLPRMIPKGLETSSMPNLENISHLEPEER
ncbi:WD repeat-containing protein on Y chromosome [Chironomus tepperi]|uniref:WD repeat-containing protein on Y chromosome n=1 Tax=Chironomus tepperi TaxID=113505 RepID=UPI00391F3B27